ncbi:MAG: hypothetical protein D8M57_19445 [Candidatus Scalindua sp. AMX11]|nr:MAG: hypothetical protein DWQ00_03025 [Candidatus Scalindua sp.]NOG82216.1 hypothetical protein [Planctomycetota bacterium]RZV65498.1 MAG: hypothetical protein EX341_17995 [Candidatus Scalindua sp. SCAELEC01]TDE63223.1 MAG: hypothetical protein D8M57_19445 [Candidatus Scalindua sp. AMX11]NOG84182.1 hypothetical protein [Planctomycetota bacterium]
MTYLVQLNDELKVMNVKGEICLYGGAVMCLVYDARPSTKDVDAVFKPSQDIRLAVENVARKNHLRNDWLNDAVKGFLTKHEQRILFNWPNLKVFVPDPDYLLAMKVFASRVDTTDKKDIQLLIQKMGIKEPKEVFDILEEYYHKKWIKPAVQFFIEELFGK